MDGARAAEARPWRWGRRLGRAAITGTAASVTSGLALAAASRFEGCDALQPLNATSHWLYGPAAAGTRSADAGHTGVGYATHHAATFFWALLFETWTGARRPPPAAQIMRDAAVMSAVAATTDYLATPRRFTPGWELVLSKRSMTLAYAAMAAGLALGSIAAGRLKMLEEG